MNEIKTNIIEALGVEIAEITDLSAATVCRILQKVS